MKDVIEHVEDRRSLLLLLLDLLAPGGRLFLAFPPWCMPFGGHQQICRSRVLSRAPYVHLLPGPVYGRVLAALGEKPSRIQNLLALQRTKVATVELERDAAELGYEIATRRFYVLNPMYSYRFGLPPLEQRPSVARLARLRDFVTTCAYYTLSPRSNLQTTSELHGTRSVGSGPQTHAQAGGREC